MAFLQHRSDELGRGTHIAEIRAFDLSFQKRRRHAQDIDLRRLQLAGDAQIAALLHGGKCFLKVVFHDVDPALTQAFPHARIDVVSLDQMARLSEDHRRRQTDIPQSNYTDFSLLCFHFHSPVSSFSLF